MQEKDVCIIAGHKDEDKERVKKMLEETPVPQVKKVISSKDLREVFCQYKDKRTLCDAYDLFVCEQQILGTITHDLGRYFFKKLKQPVTCNLRMNFQRRLTKMLNSSFGMRPRGSQMSVKMGTDEFTAQQITDNVMAGISGCVRLIPDGWGRIRKIGLKTMKSPYMTIYHALLPDEPKDKKTQNTGDDESMEKQGNAEKTNGKNQTKEGDKQETKPSIDEDKQEAKESKEEDKMETESREEKISKPAEEDVEMVSKSGEEDNKMKTGSD